MREIQIRDIGASGLVLTDTIALEETGLNKEDYVHFVTPLKVRVKLLKAETTVLCDVSVQARIETYCSRSLERIEQDWQAAFTLDFEIDPHQQTLDIQEDIRQEVILRLPMRVLSEEERKTNRVGKEIEAINRKNAHFIEEEGDRPEGTYRPFEGLEDIK